jgi:ribosomal protein S18 acetylase RimI-like enzyme
VSDGHPLDNPVRAALQGPHAHLAQRQGQVLRYPPDVSPWHALPDDPDDQAWADLALLAGPGGVGAFAGAPAAPPPGCERVMLIPGVQLVDARPRAEPDPEARRLGPADVPEMLDLVARTQPGPFAVRTIEMGSYLGIRRAGRLVAMAGERVHPPGWTEISAVCTDVEHRGQGLATRLVRAVAAGIRARGETPFLHASAANTRAVRLYTALGFELRRHLDFVALRAPAPVLAPPDACTPTGASPRGAIRCTTRRAAP